MARKLSKAQKKGKTEKYIPEFMRARSAASKKAWEKRWDRGTGPVGRKGKDYIQRTYGPEIQQEKRRYEEDEPEYEDFDFWDVEY